MKYKILCKKINNLKFLTVEFQLDKNEYFLLAKNFPSYTSSQLDPTQWVLRQSVFGTTYSQFITSNYVNNDVNPIQLNKELSVLREAGLLDVDMHKAIIIKYCQKHTGRNPQLKWTQNLHLFGATFFNDEEKKFAMNSH